MYLKKMSKNDKAVSPVIGVVLMVAITVILAAAIGSSVFGQGTSESAPQANLDIEAAGIISSNSTAIIKIEHLGGDPINFDTTKVMASVNGGNSQPITAALGTVTVGDIKTLYLIDDASTANPKEALKDNSGTSPVPMKSGNTVNIKIIDIKTSQLICDKDVRF
ncbi:type IV pilin [Methanosarcina soligelidi]|uniref:type IV pilin n=1 Tax=Methanosarcina soligelidi TaxID=1036677 RepID=UPI00064E1720|nr:type IV pilin [Methanosarcina soligelidi]